MDFKLKGDFIELDNLLKVMDLAESGARARQLVLAGLVQVNGVVEKRVRRKLKTGDFVEFDGHRYEL